MIDPLPNRIDILDGLLNRVHPPVARLRIMSTGLAQNHMLKVSDDISGTKACLACGNCVDACPVVASKPEGTMFVRTSMLLENVVAEECRRCYKCVAACPQVNLTLKEYVRSFRRIERATHWDLLVSYLVLMSTGILIHHWGARLPADMRFFLGLTHRISAIALVAAPVLFLLLDRDHLSMLFGKAFSWSKKDWTWFRETRRWLTSFGKAGALKRGAYNPAQRFWYLYVAAAILTFAITGSIKWIGVGIFGNQIVNIATYVHVRLAVATDFLVAFHIYLKLVWPALRSITRGARLFFEYRRRGEITAPLEIG